MSTISRQAYADMFDAMIAGNTIAATMPPAPNINQYIGSSERVGRN